MATAASLLAPLTFKSWLSNGTPNAFGTVATYSAGTVTPIATYVDSTATTQNQNPVPLNSRGEASIWVVPNLAYKFIEFDSLGNQINLKDQVVQSQLITLYGGVDTGAANAYILTFTASFSVLANGIVIYWVPANTNSGASTVNVNGLGVVGITNPDGSALSANQITAGQPIQMMYYNGKWVLLNGTFVPGSLVVGGTLSVTGNSTFTGNITTLGNLVTNVTGDNVGKGVPIVRFKANNTARSSNTTISLDPDLQFAVGGGSWQFEALLLFNGATTGTQGISFSLKAGGTGPASINPNVIAHGNVNGANVSTSVPGWIIGVAPGFSYTTISIVGTNDAVMLSGSLIGATSGTYGIGWCQASSSANATQLMGGSWMRMVRMG